MTHRTGLPALASMLGSTRPLVAALAFTVVTVLISYWSAHNSTYIYYWDYRNYWWRTEYLYEAFHSGEVIRALKAIIGSLPNDYTNLAAVIPALLCIPLGEPSRVKYLLITVLIYAVPAYFMICHLAKRILDSDNSQRGTGGDATPIMAFSVLLGLPLSLGVVLNLMPDIGGVIIMVAAILLAEKLVRQIVERQGATGFTHPPAAIIRTSICFAATLCFMFYFRRWYIFSAIGIAFAVLALVTTSIYMASGYRRELARRIFTAVAFSGATALLTLSIVILTWVKNLGDHNYVSLYSSYAKDLRSDLHDLISLFGIIPIVCAVGFIIIAINTAANRRLLFILVTSSAISAILFLTIQSPAWHHYYLMMPVLGVGMAGTSYFVSQRLGRRTGILFAFFLALGSILTTSNGDKDGLTSHIFPGFDKWLPKQMEGLGPIRQLGEWMASPELRDKRICLVASSYIINQSLVREIWQVSSTVPKDAFKDRLLEMSEVDSRDGAPSEAIRNCDIALVGTPPQAHLRPSEQYTVKILHDELINGTGIGLGFESLPQRFSITDNAAVLAFRRTRSISREEYSGLVSRYQEFKSLSQRTFK